MHVIFIGSDLQKLDLIPLLNGQTYFLDHFIYSHIDYRPPVLRWKHQMIEQYCHVMTLVQIDTHPTNLLHAASGGEFTLRD